MKKKILGSILILVLVIIVALNVDINTQDSKQSLLSLANVEALAFEFNGQDWDRDDHWYNNIGSDWRPVLTACTKTISTGGSIGVDTPWGGGSISWDGSTVTYSGQMVICANGNGNCVDGTDCMVQ